MGKSEVANVIEKEEVREIALQFVDISGVLHSLWVPSELYTEIAESGIHVDGSSLGILPISKSDMKLLPDKDTFLVLPPDLFSHRVARVICDLCEPDSNRLIDSAPRSILKKVLGAAKKTLGASVS